MAIFQAMVRLIFRDSACSTRRSVIGYCTLLKHFGVGDLEEKILQARLFYCETRHCDPFMHKYGIDARRIAVVPRDRDLSFCRRRLVTGREQHSQRNPRPVHNRHNGCRLARLQVGRRALKPELSTGNDREMCRDLFDFGE
jgi:hypothetical protein